MDKLARLFPLLLLLSQALWGQFAVHDKDKIASLDIHITHVLPQSGTDPLYGVQLQLGGMMWLDMGMDSPSELFLSTQHRVVLPLNNNRSQGLNTDLLPLIYLGDVSIGNHFSNSWPLLTSKTVRMMFDIHWLSLESLLLPFKDAGWHEVSLRLLNELAISLYWDDNHFLRLSATPFFFAPGIAIQNFARSGSSGYTAAVSPSGHFHAEIGFYSRLEKSWTFRITENRPFLGIFFGAQFYTPELSWVAAAPEGIDWPRGTAVTQLELGMKTWLPPPSGN